MTPDVSRFLEVASVHLLTRSLPAVGDAYEQSALGALAVLLSVVREDFDRAAERRVAENAALREIFAQAVDIVEDPALRGQLEAAAGKGGVREEGLGACGLDSVGLRVTVGGRGMTHEKDRGEQRPRRGDRRHMVQTRGHLADRHRDAALRV